MVELSERQEIFVEFPRLWIRKLGSRYQFDQEMLPPDPAPMITPFRLVTTVLLSGLMALVPFRSATSVAAETTEAEVCVYGGTSAGVMAAVEAARMGRNVVLVEQGKHLGGLSSGGLGMTDVGAVHTIGGLSREFYQRVYQHYTEPQTWTHQQREEFVAWLPKIWGVDGPRMEELKAQFLFEPHVAEGVFNDLAREAGVRVVFGERLDLNNGVHKDAARITRIVMESGREFVAKVFVDATYEGDLMAKAGVSYIVGREPNSRYHETLNGIFPFPPAPFPKISPFVVAGDPASGLLPRIEAKPPGVKGAGDQRVQAYNFRVCLTDVPENRVAFVKPGSYNPLDYEALARLIATMKNVVPGPRKHAAIGLRGNGGDLGVNFELVPNRKTDSNSGSEFGSDLTGRSYGWAEADYAGREKLWQEHKDYLMGLLWFLAHDERVPEPVHVEAQRWGLAKDEFTDNGNWPWQLYVREARRMISDAVVTEREAKGETTAEDSICIASYPLDSHGVTLYVDEGGQLWRERGFFSGSKPFPVSYRTLRPRASECVNLLVPCCLSASHAAFGSVRMEPVFMMLGHAAGTAAGLAAERQGTVQDVPYPLLRARLQEQSQILDYAPPKAFASDAAPPPPQPVPANDRLEKNLQALRERKVISSPDYWRAHAVKGNSCDGAEVAQLFVAMAGSFQPVSNVNEAIPMLIEKRLFSSRDYWMPRTVSGGVCSGDLVAAVIEKFVAVAKEK